MRKIICRLMALAVLAGCVTAPSDAFRAYQDAFDTARVQTGSLLDLYNGIEKSNDFQAEDNSRLRPDRAYLFVETADAPRTALLREGFDVIFQYNIILARYVEGNSLAAVSGDVARLQASADTIGNTFGNANIGNDAGQLLTGLQSLAQLTLIADDAKRFKASVKQNAPLVEAFLLEARTQSESMVSEARTHSVTRIRQGANAGETKEKLQSFKVMAASWVLMIDETLASLRELSAAVELDQRGSDLSQLADSAEVMERYADQLRAAQLSFRNVF